MKNQLQKFEEDYQVSKPMKQHSGFGAFWGKNKRNKILVIIAALILFSILKGVVGCVADLGSGSSYDADDTYDWTTSEIASDDADVDMDEEEATEETTEETKATTEKKEKKSSSGVTPSFKETMDDYEDFMNDYVDFMKKYEKSDNTAAMLVDYGEMMQKYAEFTEEIDAIDEDELSDADYAYYMKVTGRVTQKLAEVY